MPAPTLTYRPVVLASGARGDDLQLRVTAPVEGADLPVIVFSHGFGSSMDGYGPLADHWAAAGFVVVQPTHLDSLRLGIAPDDPRAPDVWRQRILDMGVAIDGLARIEAAVPGLAGRLDRDALAVAGHSYGATTASALLGAGAPGGEDFTDARVRAGVLLSVAGTGGDDLTPFAAEHFPFMHPTFDAVRTPSLVVAGGADQSALTVRGPDWFTDAYRLAPGAEALLTLEGAEHALGGVTAYDESPHTTPADLEHVARVQRVGTAFLRRALGRGEDDWADTVATVAGLETKAVR